LSSCISNALSQIGIRPPASFPSELEPYIHGQYLEGDPEALSKSTQRNSYYCVIDGIFHSLVEVSELLGAYAEKLDREATTLPDEHKLGAILLDLAIFKIEVDEDFAPNINEFRRSLVSKSKRWLAALRDSSACVGKPLRAELIKMIDEDAKNPIHEQGSERVSFGPVHPDVYMNEILVTFRMLSRVLPMILEKLEAK